MGETVLGVSLSLFFFSTASSTVHTSRPLMHGVFQDSVLLFLTFDIFLQQLCKVTHQHEVRYHQHDDDAHLYTLSYGQPSGAVKILSHWLKVIGVWMGRYRLKLNPVA